jgi:hypothetical protein
VPTDLPRSIVICAWLNAWRLGQVSDSDAANALETLTAQLVAGQATWVTVLSQIPRSHEPFCPAVASPGDPNGLPDDSVDQAIALTRDLLLVHGNEWALRSGEHGVIPEGAAHAGRHLAQMVTDSTQLLESLATVGSRETLESTLLQMGRDTFPPAMAPRNRDLLDRAARLWLIARAAQFSTPSSRSQEHVALSSLRDLERAARQALCAAVTY